MMSEHQNLKQIIYYKTANGKCPYDDWFKSLDDKTKSIIENRLERIKDGLYGDHKKLTNSLLSEIRINFGKGYRIYYKDLTTVIIIIIAGSDKSDQKRVIKQADKYFKDLIERTSK